MSHGIESKKEGLTMRPETSKPLYGNWVSNKLVRRFVSFFFLFIIPDVALWVLVQGWFALKVILALLAVLCLVCIAFFCRAKWLFAAEGGGIQNKVLYLLISHIEWDGKGRALDIGCGSGELTIRLAKKYHEAVITGVDYWGSEWDYNKKQCEENARIENVDGRTEFQQASASDLPFNDGTFDLVVSNLTFHEVKDSESKLDVVKEALRVVKSGGRFVFQDLFLIKQYYGMPDELMAAVSAMDVKDVHFVDTSKASFIPRALKPPFMLGTLGLIYGVKE